MLSNLRMHGLSCHLHLWGSIPSTSSLPPVIDSALSSTIVHSLETFCHFFIPPSSLFLNLTYYLEIHTSPNCPSLLLFCLILNIHSLIHLILIWRGRTYLTFQLSVSTFEGLGPRSR